MIVDEGYVRVSFSRDVPEAGYDATDTASATLPARSRRAVAAGPVGTRGVVEVYRAVGGLPQRALLGGRLRATDDGRTTVEVQLADLPEDQPETPSCPGALGRDLVPGLPSEFAGAVVGTGVHLLLSAGSLLVDRAAYDPVQSSEAAFALATQMLVEALRLGSDADDDAVEDALRSVARSLD
jgi:hypothetical protein